MFKFLRKLSKRKIVVSGFAVFLAVVVALSGVQVTNRIETGNLQLGSVTIGIGKPVIRIGMAGVCAAGTADYTCDGVQDYAQFNTAIAALPAGGGKISVLAGAYVWTDALTTVNVPANVTIEGVGMATSFTGDGATPLFTATGNNCTFSNFRTIAGGIGVNMGATTGWMWTNVYNGTTYYAYRSPYGQSVFNDATVASLTDSGLTSGRVPVAGVGGLLGDSSNLTWTNPSLQVGGSNVTRSVTYVLAPSDAPVNVKAQADIVCDGVNDEVELLASVTASGNNSSVVWLPGNYTLGATLTFPDLSDFILYAESTIMSFTPVVGDAVVVSNAANCEFHFGRITSGTTGARLSFKPTNATSFPNIFTFTKLIGIGKLGQGLKLDNSVQGSDTNHFYGGDITSVDVGVLVTNAPDAGHKCDTNWFWLSYIRECNTLIQEGTSVPCSIDTNIWYVNMGNPIVRGLDTYADNGHYFLIIEAGSGKVIRLRAGVGNTIIETVPPLQAGDLLDESAATSNRFLGSTSTVDTTGTLTLTNKTLTSPTINGTVSTTGGLTINGYTLGGVLNAGGNNITNVFVISSPTNSNLQLYGKSQAGGSGITLYTTGVTPTFTDTARLSISTSLATAVALWTNITHTGLVLSGNLDLQGQNIDNVGILNSPTNSVLKLYGKSTAGGNALQFYTTNAAFADTSRLAITGSLNTAVATWNAVTQSGVVFTTGSLPKFGDNATGSGLALLGANCPAPTDNTSPYTWLKVLSEDGSTVYIPAWK